MDLKSIRQLLGLSQVELAGKLHMSKSAISAIESGKRKLTERTISQICDVFNLNSDWVINGKGEPFVDSDDIVVDDFIIALTKSYYDLSDDDKAFFKDLCCRFGIVKKEDIDSKAI